MHLSLLLQLLFAQLICTLFIIKAFNNQFEQYTFYYETYQYPINAQLTNNKNKNKNATQNDTDSNSIYIDIMIDNLIINILKSSSYPYVINIIKNKKNITQNHNPIHNMPEPHINITDDYIEISIQDITNSTTLMNGKEHGTETAPLPNEHEISLNYEDYENWNEVQIWNTPHRHRRRLRQCHKRGWRPFHYYTKRYWCRPIAPPRSDPYWLRRSKRIGRFIAVYPGIWSVNRFNFDRCAAFCRQNYGGLAAIHSNREKEQAKSACHHVLAHPAAANKRDYGGNWRGHSCFIGLRRPFKQWQDKSKYNYGFWQPGEPNNGGRRRVCTRRKWWGGCKKYEWRKNADEDCTELYAFHYGRWNDIACTAKRSCLCQKPSGHIHGPYIAVSATRTYKEANLYCKTKYGTTLATIESDGNNKHVMNACKAVTQHGSLGHCWIGLQRPFHEWDDGTNAEEKFENWYPGEPNSKNEKCVEMYTEHRGLWNDLRCNYKRYFVCNAQTKLQRMDYDKREEMIRKRMSRHQLKWQRYQAQAKRKKIRKMFFQKMKQRRAAMRKRRREAMQKRRESMRQSAFRKAMGSRNKQSGIGGFGGGFGANSVFGDTYLKRRRMRIMIEKESNGYRRRMNAEVAELKHADQKKEIFKKDKQFYREMEDKMWANEMEEMEGNEEVNEILLERVDPSPKRCVLFEDGAVLYEFCVNDDFVFVKKYVEKVWRDNEEFEYVAMERAEYNDSNLTVHGTDVDDDYFVGFGRFESYKYEQAMRCDEDTERERMEINKVDNDLQYVRIDEFIYNHDSNHRRQCFSEKKPYEMCLEYDNIEKEMVLYLGMHLDFEQDMFAFEEDKKWNEVNHVHMKDEDGADKLVKCVMFYESKVCLIEQFKENKDGNDEYRVIILTQMNENDEDQYTHPEDYDEYD